MFYWIPTLIMMSILLKVDLDAFMNYYFFFTLNPVLRLYVFALGILGKEASIPILRNDKPK